ncbi:MAG TPA: biotin--[acetyl-CoA-carboxylase] ligase [Eubacteriales bacterium]|nr:biotin--[acetyl-CoA-carboxylase] ligase [Eubacteriales bacterium]
MLLTQKKVNKIFLERGNQLPCSFSRKTDSTNSLAKKLLQTQKLSNGTVLAQQQMKGRGRYDRTFLSKKGKGVYMTFVAPYQDEFGSAIGGLCCLAVVDAVKNLYNVDCTIKWPNDVLFNGKKLCGILPETVVINEKRHILVGVGVNVNYTKKDFGYLGEIAVSLLQIIGKKMDTVVLASEISKNLNEITSEFKQNYSMLLSRYVDKCETLGKIISVEKDGRIISGIAEKIDDDCSLVILTGDKRQKIAWGEITLKK